MNKKILNSGFTLIELMLYMALMSIFLIVLSELFVSILETKKESEAVSSVEQDGRYILARLNYDINRSEQLISPASAPITDSSLVLDINGTNYTYSLNGNNLTLQSQAVTNNLNSSGSLVSALSFQRLGAGSKPTIKISFTLRSRVERIGGPETKVFTTTVGLR